MHLRLWRSVMRVTSAYTGSCTRIFQKVETSVRQASEAELIVGISLSLVVVFWGVLIIPTLIPTCGLWPIERSLASPSTLRESRLRYFYSGCLYVIDILKVRLERGNPMTGFDSSNLDGADRSCLTQTRSCLGIIQRVRNLNRARI